MTRIKLASSPWQGDALIIMLHRQLLTNLVATYPTIRLILWSNQKPPFQKGVSWFLEHVKGFQPSLFHIGSVMP